MDIKALCKEAGLEFYDDELASENGRKIYRVYIMKDGGVSLQDCANFSELLSPILDVEPPTDGEYSLEVSSVGLERTLKKIEHFQKSIGELVKISTKAKESIEAKLLAVDGDLISLETQEGVLKLEFSEIKKARTFILWDK
ncbi:ribosome maturation factor RimP [Campylobacter avium]|uniref:ribosome maturation factor RimP n=1 Tax=Campylobacter avium TaxID=522485 RepID=UPI001D603FA4|nr:ribosome maturation factor RimP [Campylobacter avium]HJE66138.1 ribosome maturation factor RimP [Campylobacter avium]